MPRKCSPSQQSRANHIAISIVSVLLTVVAVPATAFPQAPGPTSPGGAPSIYGSSVGNVIVYLRTQDGDPLPQTAVPLIRLTSLGDGMPLPNSPSLDGDGWIFTGLAIGNDYEIRVSANGYLPGTETVGVPAMPGATSTVVIFLKRQDEQLVFRPPSGEFVLAPKAAKEVQRALKDLQSNRTVSAQKHAQKALDLAPGNPYVQYVMGMTFVLSRQFVQAKPYLEKSVSIDPKEAQSLSALGNVRYRLGDDAGAIKLLTKVVEMDKKSWRAEWLLADSYLREKKYVEARDHADRALKIDRQKTGQVELLLGRALAGLGVREEAASAFEAFATEFPKDPNATTALEWAKWMRQPVRPAASLIVARPVDSSVPTSASNATSSSTPPPEPPVEVPPRPNWAPPNIDAAHPFLISGASCALPQVLKKAGHNAEQFVRDLQEFSATEDFQEIELKHGSDLQKPTEHQFEYLVLIDRPSPRAFDVKEIREKDSVRTQLPGRIQDLGAAALALAFHPLIQRDLNWKCEGLGTWDDQPAWVVRFEQNPKAQNVLAWFSGVAHSYPLPLKGRAWVSERSGEVLHLDTDLVHAIRPVDLQREHFSIDYRPVAFRKHHMQLWLPDRVDTYVQYQGHFLHFYHSFSDFKLFWVGTTQRIAAPKEADKLQENKQEEQ